MAAAWLRAAAVALALLAGGLLVARPAGLRIHSRMALLAANSEAQAEPAPPPPDACLRTLTQRGAWHEADTCEPLAPGAASCQVDDVLHRYDWPQTAANECHVTRHDDAALHSALAGRSIVFAGDLHARGGFEHLNARLGGEGACC